MTQFNNTVNNTTNNFVFEDTEHKAFEKLLSGVDTVTERLKNKKEIERELQLDYAEKLTFIYDVMGYGSFIMQISDYARKEMLKGARLKGLDEREAYLKAYLYSMQNVRGLTESESISAELRYLMYANVFNFFFIEQGLEPVNLEEIDSYYKAAKKRKTDY